MNGQNTTQGTNQNNTNVNTNTNATETQGSNNTNTNIDTNNNTNVDSNNNQEQNTNNNQVQTMTNVQQDYLDKQQQANEDRLRTQVTQLTKELEDLKKSKMTEAELSKYELDKERAIVEAEKKANKENANRFYAVTKLNSVGLGDVSEEGNIMLVDLVMADEQVNILKNIDNLKTVIDSRIKVEVDKTFKATGREPSNGTTGAANQNEGTLFAKQKNEQNKVNNKSSIWS